MLNTNKSININGSSIINGSITASMYANINHDGSININSNINDVSFYEANKEEVRADIEAFTALVYSIQDDEASISKNKTTEGTVVE